MNSEVFDECFIDDEPIYKSEIFIYKKYEKRVNSIASKLIMHFQQEESAS